VADPTPTAQDKVEAAIASILRTHPALADWTVLTDLPLDVAIEDEDSLALLVRTMSLEFDNSFEPGAQTLNVPVIDIEAVVKEAGDIIVARAREGLAHAQAALCADRTLGGMLQDLAEQDVAPGDGQRRDVGAISMQWRAEYLTAPSNPFVILGHAGMEF
jgi:hypothetical protein